MMKYTLTNRKKSISARNNSEFVTWMRKNDMQQWSSNKEFMEGYAHRKSLFEQIVLSPESEDSFVRDLIKNKLLEIKKPKAKFLRFLKFSFKSSGTSLGLFH
ncbi:hypothetical protein [Chryseobacterium koreense]